jgi:hypothetical protein
MFIEANATEELAQTELSCDLLVSMAGADGRVAFCRGVW